MTCQEVMEYMQRDLDRDLSTAETEVLKDHATECEQCAKLYDRLSRLSHNLDNLPKVKPPYSIVDQILPQLEQIDLQHSGVKDEQVTETKVNGFRSTTSFKLIGSVAAAMILVVMIVSGILQEGQNPEQMASMVNDTNENVTTESFSTEVYDQMGRSRSMAFDEAREEAQAESKLDSQIEEDTAFSIMGTADNFATPQLKESSSAKADIQAEYPSHDGRYSLIVYEQESRLQIQIVTQSGDILFTSAEILGESISEIRWDEASEKVLYKVDANSGSVEFVVSLPSEDK